MKIHITMVLILNYYHIITIMKIKYFYSEKYYEKYWIFRNIFESIWSLGTPPNDLFINFIYFSVINQYEL
jgi:hypothetical protein